MNCHSHINYTPDNFTQRGFLDLISNQEVLVIPLSHCFHFSLFISRVSSSVAHTVITNTGDCPHSSALSFLCSEQMENDLRSTAATEIIWYHMLSLIPFFFFKSEHLSQHLNLNVFLEHAVSHLSALWLPGGCMSHICPCDLTFTLYDLDHIWKCYTVHIWSARKSWFFFLFYVNVPAHRNTFCLCACDFLLLWRYLHHVKVHLKPKSLAVECIMISFDTRNSRNL